MLSKKVCPRCKINKPASEYRKSIKNISGLMTYCKECMRKRSYEDGLKSRYGMTQKQYDGLYNKQKGCCAICKRHQSGLNHRLYVDHNHKTGEVRGLLCNRCNQKVAVFEGGYVEEIKKYLQEAHK